MRYKLLEHTADSLIKAFGSTVEECFENAAYGMFDQMIDAGRVELKKNINIEVAGDDLDSLLYNFLSELLFIFDAKKLALAEFEVSIKDHGLSCTAWGEPFDARKHAPKKEIKAVTYHMLKVEEKEPSVTVLFDI
ncbi:MAG: archease [Euryarchaeota archaeon]|nr:archease [Euryarchaeota archaeon]